MPIPPCILTLVIVYPALLAAGWLFFRHMQKTKPHPLPDGDPRYRYVGLLRFLMFVVLLPLAVTLSLAILGWLDPLFWMVRDTLY